MTSCDFSSSDYELSAFDIESIISAASQSTFEHSKNTFVYSDHTDMETKMCSKSAEPALLCVSMKKKFAVDFFLQFY